MNITLDQLKEIAKAGYEDWYSDIMLNRDTWSYITHPNRYVIMDEGKPEFTMLINDAGNNIHFETYGVLFNSLAAIRKKEELGLIEK